MAEAELTVTVGLPCSGKSKYAQMLHKETGTYVVSISNIRRNLRKKNSDVTEREIFDTVYSEVRDCLVYGYDCILDGTYIKAKQREHLFHAIDELMPGTPFKKTCVIVATPIQQIFYTNIIKGNRLPDELITQMYHDWQTPGYWEGWDEIWMYYDKPEWMGMNGEYGSFPEEYIGYDLNDKDHFDSLGGHCNSVHNHLLKLLHTRDPKGKDEVREKSLLAASLIHDCGKPIVETREEGKSLYYNHANVGAYESMFYKVDSGVDSIYVSALVDYHMDPYDWEKADSARAYAVKKFGGEFVEDLSMLHQADEMAKERS